ncbi:hypothetical protein F4810DRAFT_674693 [Camillea tinctor]|nr:hypothetical protein F4810DRAFT_674693 [Camillea tinctor]
MPRLHRNRATLACARCYVMKKKCDRKAPSCTRCVQARVPCQGINRSNNSELPRSALRYLEQLVAETTDLPPRDGAVTTGGTLDRELTEVTSFRDKSLDDFIRSFAVMCSSPFCTPTLLRGSSKLYHSAKLFYPSERPPLKLAVGGAYYEGPPTRASQKTTLQPSDANVLRIPLPIAKRLLSNYIERILPIYPCFSSNDLEEHFQRVYLTDSRESPDHLGLSRFIVFMVLSISSLSSKAQDFIKVASLSEILQEDALLHSPVLLEANISSLQCLALLIQHALMLPYAANLWYLTGESMRIAVSLGLHQERGPALVDSLPHVDLGQRVFWTLYQLERAVAISSGCPLAINDEHITAELSSNVVNLEVSGECSMPIQPREPVSKEFTTLVKLHRIRSAIHAVQFFDQALPDQLDSYEKWQQYIQDSIKRTVEDSGLIAAETSWPDWLLNETNYSYHLLHRPCPRNFSPSASSLISACKTAIDLICGYWSVMRSKGRITAFQFVSNAFQAGMVLLYALSSNRDTVKGAGLEDSIFDTVKVLDVLLDTLSARWPAAVRTRQYLGSLAEYVMQDPSKPYHISKDSHIIAELDYVVTQRRVYSVYHGNVIPMTRVDSTKSPASQWSWSDSFIPDNMWWEYIDFGPDSEDAAASVSDINHLSENVHIIVSPDNQSTSDLVLSDQVPFPEVVDSLPTCNFCRDHHLGCDKDLPSCRTCTRAGRDCVYYDAVLSLNVQRSYIHQLLERLKAVRQQHADVVVDMSVPLKERRVSSSATTANHILDQNVYVPYVSMSKLVGEGATYQSSKNLNSTLDASFYGPSSAYVSLRTALSSMPDWKPKDTSIRFPTAPVMDLFSDSFHQDSCRPSRPLALYLLNLFRDTVNTFYPVMHEKSLYNLLDHCYPDVEPTSFSHGHEIMHLILAIGACLVNGNILRVNFTPSMFIQKFLSIQDLACDHASPADQLFFLQKTLLVCLYLLFRPGSGDIWRILGFAIRLYFDLSHRPLKDASMDNHLMIMLSRTLYCLESKVSIAYGRPSLLVIGDKLREEMTTPLAYTPSELISIYFYQSSFLKMRVHSLILSNPSLHPQKSLRDQCEQLRSDLISCHISWKKTLGSLSADFPAISKELKEILEAWGNLQHYHAIFLLSKLSSDLTDLSIEVANNIIESSTILIQHQQQQSIYREGQVYTFPLDWTLTHLVFSVGVHILSPTYNSQSMIHTGGGTMSKCLTVLSCLENNPVSPSIGFVPVLKGLYEKQGK